MTGTGPLSTASQLALERRALDLLATPELRAARDRVAALYRADRNYGSHPAGVASLEAAAASITVAAVQHALVADPARPVFLWSACSAHGWHGIDMPNSGYGIDNPDNVHRRSAVDGESTYVVRGRVPEVPAAQFSFICYGAPEADGNVTREGAAIASVVLSSQLVPDADGRFELTVGPAPVDDRPHLLTAPTSTWMLVRDALTDWESQDPLWLEIERIAGPDAAPEPTDADLVELAVANVERLSRYWLDYDNQLIHDVRPLNAIKQPTPRPFGASVVGRFDVAAHEGLLVTLDPCGADYLGFEVTDPWGVTRPSVEATGGLNNRQAKANADGTLTYLVAATDPGVHNWLDTGGLTAGMVAARWQGGQVAEDAEPVREVRVVPLRDVTSFFSDEHRITPEGRAEQLQQRAAAFARRLR
ncbi:DUF1214 domain-containing protein [Nocardioides sp. Soil796]|uniref:DUF1214 domain-containing protein n=1 Tax=Nocardioides sp. Soil796 TaxID=1736412 RepID=UPI00070A8CF3|nr:DUF1214 domain-containing protein [Nocardioides sp. Soil796]KRF14618.1 hypothetical protein ASH02_09920 [Nocardioides sp. Soil796]